MKIYFYHTQDIQYILQKMQQGEFPPHFLYGSTKLPQHGIEVVWHRSKLGQTRLRMMWRTAWQILTCKESFDAVYATHYRGLELIIFLRALHLFRKPVVVWHHQPIIQSPSKLRQILGKLFYKGFDALFFFSRKLIDDSISTRKYPAERMYLGHWGADIPYYNKVCRQTSREGGFISTGKELRDMPTLVAAFNKVGAPLHIYVNKQNGALSYDDVFADLALRPNIAVHYTDRLMPYELAKEVNKAACVVVCCQETKYTVGLTTVVEALAMGLPVICSRNPQIPIDLDKEGCGITVPYGDVEGWVEAVRRMSEDAEAAAEMGRRGRLLAERLYNDEQCAAEVAACLKQVCKAR